MNLDHGFVQVWKFSEDQNKIANETLFSPSSGEDQKKRSCTRIEHFVSLNLHAQMYTHSNYWGGCRCGTFSNYWGDTAKLLGEIYPPSPPGFGTPDYAVSYGIYCTSICIISTKLAKHRHLIISDS